MSAGTNRSIPTPVSVPNGGTGLTAGTSGGIPAYTGATTIASSGVLAANSLMKGGGAGVAPSTITTGAGVITALGIAPNASGGFSTLRSFTGSTSLNGFAAIGGGPTQIAITVTGAASGDNAIIAFPPANGNGTGAAIAGIVVTTNTVTVYLYGLPDDTGIFSDATWTNGQTIIAQIIK